MQGSYRRTPNGRGNCGGFRVRICLTESSEKSGKNVKYILAIGGDCFFYYTGKMRGYAGDIPLHHFVYAASEGVFGLAEHVDSPDRYMLLPESVFFEFMPVGEDKRPLLMGEVEIGGKYELIVTNRSGLYRYRLGDVVRVVGKGQKKRRS